MRVDIVCAVHNGARFLPDLLLSLQTQTVPNWTLWLYDDHSTDESADVLRAAASADERLRIVPTRAERGGASASFSLLLSAVPSDAAYVMFADQDDVWLPRKIEQTLAAMRTAEAGEARTAPVLVHTDLTVVDEQLQLIHQSFWQFSGIDPHQYTLRRIIIRNVVTGATMMINRALRELVDPIPPDAALHDSWCACTAAAFGRIVAVPEATILYRQHATNAVGARRWKISVKRLPGEILRAVRRTPMVRRDIARAAAQAGAFVRRYGSRLSEEDRRFLEDLAAVPEHRFWRRKRELLRLRWIPENAGVLRKLGILVRG